MSPEHFMAAHPDDLDARADIYSLGILLYELFNPKGLPPFRGPLKRIEELHLKAPVPQLPKAGEKLSGVIARCLEKNPAHRYQSVEELLDDLEERQAAISLEASTGEIEIELEEIWEKASLSFSQRDFKEAARLVEEVLKADSNHPGARRLREELSSRFSQADQFYQEIARNLEVGDLSDLAGLLKDAADIYPEHSAGGLVQTKLSARARRYKNAMEEGMKALREERWELALQCLRQALELHSGAENLRQIIELLTRIEDMRREIDQALAQGEFKKALRFARLVDLQVEQMKSGIPAMKGTER
jgi:tetratricopeptide (TPR) repeat protein